LPGARPPVWTVLARPPSLPCGRVQLGTPRGLEASSPRRPRSMEAGATQPPAPSRRGGGGGGVGSPAAAAAAETGPGNSSSLRAAGTGCGLGGVNGPQLSPGTDSADENSDDDGDADISAYGDEDSGGPSLGRGGCGPPEPLKGDGERPSCRADLAWQPFHERESDLAGELSRKLSRVQAIAKKHPLKTWEREWCVASHNFLMLFASRTNHVVRKCVLMSAVRSVEPSRDGRSFRVAVDSREGVREAPELLVLRVPRGRNAAGGDEARAQEVRRWVEEVKRRADAAVDSGNRLVPCMPLSEAGPSDLSSRVVIADLVRGRGEGDAGTLPHSSASAVGVRNFSEQHRIDYSS